MPRISVFIQVWCLVLLILFTSCEKIEPGNALDAETTNLITSLGLLDKDEQIVYFYSNYKKSRAGSFFTDKRIARYWLEDQPAKTEIKFSFYKDIVSIDTVYKVPYFDCPYMIITSKNGTKFRAYVDGDTQEKRAFFEKVISLWRKSHSLNLR
ncbi:hypothetical protein [Hymenobacter cellulosilyticus]|uniref:Lipoprotein n=1 Tax=Hymenobacter cellulosilyticus TaxID=2932248 RepID=A0A8T9QAL2_9BACT|nr:hypothetical protein [Hymenobacter cellulosilyticus]UOQ74205.1 hypothetical protein MUN79_10130 [Hymenobacter cellulosilyticus]